MDRFRVTLGEQQAEERQALRQAFVKGTAIDFRGRRVTVWGEFRHEYREYDEPEYVYELQPER